MKYFIKKKRRCILLAIAIILFSIIIISFCCQNEPQEIHEELPIEPTKSSEMIEKPNEIIDLQPEEEPEPEIESEPVLPANKLENVRITYYCAEQYPHICNAGYPYVTARGNAVVPYYTCAVDKNVIPLGSTVYVDYGDGVLHEYYADDVGGAIKGNRLDIAVETHSEALNCGIKYATVYWEN